MANRIGVFGGSFSPIHYGHINSILNVKEKMNLDCVQVIPAYQSPGKDLIESPTPIERLELVKLGLADYLGEVQVEDCELDRGGVSYSVDTLRGLSEKHSEDTFYLIIGLDQFGAFDSWKDFKEILSLSNLVVTSRPGFYFPLSVEDFPEGLKGEVEDFDGYTAVLKSGQQIHFVRLEDYDISSSDIRKKVRLNQSINKYVPLEVENFIKDKSLYTMEEGVDYDSKDLQAKIKSILDYEGGINTLSFDLREQNQITDFNIVTSSQSKKANSKLAEKLVEEIKNDLGVKPLGVDGKEDANWIVVDYGSVIVHLFYEFVRGEYNLEKLWSNYPQA